MTIREYKELKRQIDKILQKMEEEALEQGIVIASQEFQDFLQQARVELLNRRGISVEEFESFEGERKREKKEKLQSFVKELFGEKGDKGDKGEKGERGEKGEEGKPGKSPFTPAQERKILEHIAVQHFTKEEAEDLIGRAFMMHERRMKEFEKDMKKELENTKKNLEKKVEVLQERQGDIPKITVSTIEPMSPETGDIWVTV